MQTASPPTALSWAAAIPGLLVAAVGAAIAFAIGEMTSLVSPLVAAAVVGAVLTNMGWLPPATRPGLQLATRRLLRLGVVLLGFQLAFDEVLGLGARSLGIVFAVVVITFFGTQAIGRVLGVGPTTSLLVATGFSICGASAIAAVEGVVDADEEEVAFSVALVTLCGTLAVLTLPVLARPLGLDGERFGTWVGASVHDVGQVVAAASTHGSVAVQAAVLVKLTRIACLGPLVAGVALSRRRREGVLQTTDGRVVKRPPVVPLFVIGFLAAAAVRSGDILATVWLDRLELLGKVLLAMALVGLGSGVHVAKLRRLGMRPLALGLSSWLLIAAVAYVGVLLTA